LFLAASMGVLNGTPPASMIDQRKRILSHLDSQPMDGLTTRTAGLYLMRSALNYLEIGDRASADDNAAKLLRLNQRVSDADTARYLTLFDVIWGLLDGRLVEAAALGSDVLRDFPFEAARITYLKVRALIWLGEKDEAVAALAAIGSEYRNRVRLMPLQALLFAEAGNLERAHTLLATALKAIDFNENTEVLLLTPALATAILLRDSELIQDLETALKPAANQLLCNGAALLPIAHVLGQAAAIGNRPEDARFFHHASIELCSNVRFRPELALSRLGLAELLLEHYPDERAEAVEHLDFAIAEFRAMKMQPSLERALRHRGLLKA
jgi:hypothetical protein